MAYTEEMASPDASPLTGLSHLQLHVSDMDASAAWYEQVLGMEETGRVAGRYIGLQAVGGQIRLALSPGGMPNSSGALNHVAFAVSDFDALTSWVEHLSAMGISHQGIKPNPLGHSVDLFDPDGNNIEIVSES